MLFLITLFTTILLAVVLALAVAFIYGKLVQLSVFWRNVGGVVFFAVSCHYFGATGITILLLLVLVAALNFILQLLLNVSITKSPDNGGLTIYSIIMEGGSFSYSKYRGYPKPGSVAEPAQNQELNLQHENLYAPAQNSFISVILFQWHLKSRVSNLISTILIFFKSIKVQ